jgi:hypothetical protein
VTEARQSLDAGRTQLPETFRSQRRDLSFGSVSGTAHVVIWSEVANPQVSARNSRTNHDGGILAEALRQSVYGALVHGVRTEHD